MNQDLTDSEDRIVEFLLDGRKVDPTAVERARQVQSSNSEPLHHLLTKLGLVSERDLATAFTECLGIKLAGPEDYPDEPLYEEKLNLRFLREVGVLPLSLNDNVLSLAMTDPLNNYAVNAIEMISGVKVNPLVAVPAELETAFNRIYLAEAQGGVGEGAEEFGSEERLDIDVDRLRDLASEAPVIRLVNQLISKGVEIRASDLHIEPFEGKLRVRYRIDGVLQEIDPPAFKLRAAIVSRIKIMANLNIAERRLPQDGRIKMAIRGISVDLRISVIPTMFGESLVLRILDRQGATLDLEKLGVDGLNFELYKKILSHPHGVFLVTGPTGSGKTTSLYASLLRLNSPEKKILTVEDPIEYELEGINQIQTKPNIGLSFANVLRSILRQDPDIIMIGEIRDSETAEIAVQAALTGHLVVSTLHTNNAASAITRLLDMRIDDFLVTSTLIGASAQRLVRKLCQECRTPYQPLPEVIDQLGLRRCQPEGEIVLYQAKGCEACRHTGFHGRTCLAEVLLVSESIRQIILQKSEATELQRQAVEEGMVTLYDDGLRKSLAGITTPSEVLRVTREI